MKPAKWRGIGSRCEVQQSHTADIGLTACSGRGNVSFRRQKCVSRT